MMASKTRVQKKQHEVQQIVCKMALISLLRRKKNCFSLLLCSCKLLHQSSVKVTQSHPTLCYPHELEPTRLLCPQGFCRQEYWSGLPCLQAIFPTQGVNPGLPPCKQILYHLSHQGRQRILEWVAYPFSSGSS